MGKSLKKNVGDDLTHYARRIHAAVRKKWKTNEEKEAWYTKFSAVRRTKTRRCSEAQGHHCATCGTDTYMTDDERVERKMSRWQLATLEHLKPQSKGGTDHPNNVIMTCTRCNSKRGDMDIKKFYRILQDPVLAAAFMRSTAESRRQAAERRAARKIEKHPEKMDRAAFRLAMTEFYFPGFLNFWAGLSDEDRINIWSEGRRATPPPKPTTRRSSLSLDEASRVLRTGRSRKMRRDQQGTDRASA